MQGLLNRDGFHSARKQRLGARFAPTFFSHQSITINQSIMKEKFVIVSIRHTDSDGIMYWRENNSGYTYSPFEAGQYDAAKVIASLDYYFDYGSIPFIALSVWQSSTCRESVISFLYF